MAKEALEFIINSPDRDQIIATQLGKVVGMATVTLHVTPSGTEGWLNDFITSPDPGIRGHGVGRRIFDEVMDWCNERDVALGFTSMDPAVHPIYKALGATPDYTTTRFSAAGHNMHDPLLQ
ncbi:MAG: GNAT family N-acetyltransferase [Candidatus Saccharimonadales bacterium]